MEQLFFSLLISVGTMVGGATRKTIEVHGFTRKKVANDRGQKLSV